MNVWPKFLPETVGKQCRRTFRAGCTLKVRLAALAAGLATTAAIVAVVPHGTPTHTHNTTRVSNVAGATVTSAELRELRDLTPAQASQLDQALEKGFSKLGIRAGLGNAQPQGTAEATLMAYDWSGGIRSDHAWVTASYANLAPYVNAVSGIANYATRYAYIYGALFAGVCVAVGAATGGFGAVACGILTAWIATAAANIHGTLAPLDNGGIWAAYYWWPRVYTTGGYW